MITTTILAIWLLGLLSFGILAAGIYLLYEWQDRAWHLDPATGEWMFDPALGANTETLLLAGGVLLLGWAFAGNRLVKAVMRIKRGRPPEAERPRHERGGTPVSVQAPDGTRLHAEVYGPEEAPPIILIHGWGCDATEWFYLRRQLAGRFRLIAWDLPGLGRSEQPPDRNYSLENLARCLDAVLDQVSSPPALLLGHSIGGMIMLTHARLFPEALGQRVAAHVLVHTTYTNPVRTTRYARLHTALERPVLVPLLYLTIWLSPLVRLMNWMSYLNGTAHMMNMKTSFGGTETWDEVEFATRYQLKASPAVLARGMFGMLDYDAMAVLPDLSIPALVVPGDRDPICVPEASQRMTATLPAAHLIALAPAKHMGLIEHHQTFAETVATFAGETMAHRHTPLATGVK